MGRVGVVLDDEDANICDDPASLRRRGQRLGFPRRQGGQADDKLGPASRPGTMRLDLPPNGGPPAAAPP